MQGDTVLILAAFAMLSGCEWFDRTVPPIGKD